MGHKPPSWKDGIKTGFMFAFFGVLCFAGYEYSRQLMTERVRDVTHQMTPSGQSSKDGSKDSSKNSSKDGNAQRDEQSPERGTSQRVPSSAASDAHSEAGDEASESAQAEEVVVSKADWARVLDVFHQAKARLKETLVHQNHYAVLKKQIDEVRLVRPVAGQDTDLFWRGIGAWVQGQSSDGSSAQEPKQSGWIRTSPGFLQLIFTKPKQGLFEMTRLVAQSVAPCELERLGLSGQWDRLLDCFSYRNLKKQCLPGAVSEVGWAVSSSLAFLVSHPEEVPSAFDQKERRECLEKQIHARK